MRAFLISNFDWLWWQDQQHGKEEAERQHKVATQVLSIERAVSFAKSEKLKDMIEQVRRLP